LTSALAGGKWSASCPGRFTPGTHWIGDWMGPRTGLYDVERRKIFFLPGFELWPSSQSLYRLWYPGPQYYKHRFLIKLVLKVTAVKQSLVPVKVTVRLFLLIFEVIFLLKLADIQSSFVF
jgi:hypothetical protein